MIKISALKQMARGAGLKFSQTATGGLEKIAEEAARLAIAEALRSKSPKLEGKHFSLIYPRAGTGKKAGKRSYRAGK